MLVEDYLSGGDLRDSKSLMIVSSSFCFGLLNEYVCKLQSLLVTVHLVSRSQY